MTELCFMMDLTSAFIEAIQDNSQFIDAVNIIRTNSSGSVWLIGGSVYRTLANRLYGTPSPDVDLDFIVERPVKEFRLPTGWKVTQNKYGDPKFVHVCCSVDYIPLETVHSILRRRLEPTIDNFLTGTPLTIQSITYSVNDQKIIGEICIDALLRKEVAVNNLEQARIYAKRKGIPLNEIIERKAKSLQFTPIFEPS